MPKTRVPSGGAHAPSSSDEKPRSAADTVVDHLEDAIFDGTYDAGDSLPSESELSTSLGVSRLTVREGVRSLVARGLVEVSHGRRPVVSQPNSSQLRDFFSSSVRRDVRGLLDLLEVRLAIEVHTAELAARHATRGDVASIEAALTTMRGSTQDEAAFNEADVQFHYAIAVASGNLMLKMLVEGMEMPLRDSRIRSIRGFLTRERDLELLIEPHSAIFEAIASHDPTAARRAMRKHLITTRRDLRRSTA